MPRRGYVKNRRQYEGLRRKGMSKQRAAKITNAGKSGSRAACRSQVRKSPRIASMVSGVRACARWPSRPSATSGDGRSDM